MAGVPQGPEIYTLFGLAQVQAIKCQDAMQTSEVLHAHELTHGEVWGRVSLRHIASL